MKRIQKERDRLLRKIARIYGLTGAVGALLCIIVPGTATGIQFAAAAVLSVAAGALVFLHTERGGLPDRGRCRRRLGRADRRDRQPPPRSTPCC